MYGPAEFQVAAQSDGKLVQAALQRADGHQIRQRLGRMPMSAVAGVDYRDS